MESYAVWQSPPRGTTRQLCVELATWRCSPAGTRCGATKLAMCGDRRMTCWPAAASVQHEAQVWQAAQHGFRLVGRLRGARCPCRRIWLSAWTMSSNAAIRRGGPAAADKAIEVAEVGVVSSGQRHIGVRTEGGTAAGRVRRQQICTSCDNGFSTSRWNITEHVHPVPIRTGTHVAAQSCLQWQLPIAALTSLPTVPTCPVQGALQGAITTSAHLQRQRTRRDPRLSPAQRV